MEFVELIFQKLYYVPETNGLFPNIEKNSKVINFESERVNNEYMDCNNNDVIEENFWKIQNKNNQLLISMTNECNMRCKYCIYQEDRYQCNNHTANITNDILFKAIDKYFLYSKYAKRKRISFYGGEPLLQWEKIQNAVDYIHNKFTGDVEFAIITNGLLLTDEVIDFLILNDFEVTISLDGPQYIHDRYRVDNQGNYTYDRIMDNLSKIKNKNLKFYDKIKFNAVEAPPEDFERLCLFFEGREVRLSEITITDYFRNYLEQIGIDINSREIKTFNLKNYSVSRNWLASLKRYQTLNLKVNTRILSDSFCFPLSKKIFVTTKGNFVVCEKVNEDDPRFVVGNVETGINEEKIIKLLNIKNEIQRKNCASCWARRYCFVCFTNIDKIDFNSRFCIENRKMVRDQMIFYYNLITGDKGEEWRAYFNKIIMM